MRYARGMTFVAAALFLAGFLALVWYASKQPGSTAQNYNRNQNHQESYTEYCERKLNKTFWEKTRCDPVAYFTVWLVGFSGILAASTIGLWIVTWASAKAARGTVDAMRDDFISTHRPKIRIKHIWLNALPKAGEAITVTIIIVNTGSIAAEIREGSFAAMVLPVEEDLPAEPPLANKRFGVTTPILPSGITYRFDVIGDQPLWKLSQADVTGIETETHRLFCFGSFDYRDTSPGEPRIQKTSYCRTMKKPGSRRLVLYSDRDYEYDD
jgi:hypothetical protein